MKVKVEFTVETDGFGEEEFKSEIEKLIFDVDPLSELLDFKMYEIKKDNTKG